MTLHAYSPTAPAFRRRRPAERVQPTQLQVCLAYVANGDVPPLSAFAPPKPLPWRGGPCPGAPALPGGFPKPDSIPAPTRSERAAFSFLFALRFFSGGVWVAGVLL